MDHSAAVRQRMAKMKANAAKNASKAPKSGRFSPNGGLFRPLEVRIGGFTVGATVQTFDIGMPAPMPLSRRP